MLSAIPIHVGGQQLDYELIDTGETEKLERFGNYVLRRPEPQALWKKSLAESEWNSLAHASYERLKQSHYRDADEVGSWHQRQRVPEPWLVHYALNERKLQFKLALTAFKHVGLFPEQTCNWVWISAFCQTSPGMRVLNLFGYTGAASIVACAQGAEVTHLDAVKNMITWTRENMEINQLSGIRWVVEDALKFVQREARRSNKYTLIIMDPPAYGRGPDGEKWVLEKSLIELVATSLKLLTPGGKILLNLYSLNHSAILLRNLGANGQHWGENVLVDRSKKGLPLGIFGVLDADVNA